MNHGLAARIARRIDRLVAKLQQTLRIGEGSVFLGVPAAGNRKTSVPIVFGLKFAAFDFRRVVPERSGLRLDHVAHDQPFQLRHSFALQAAIGRSHRGILAHDEQASILPSAMSSQ